MESWDDAEQFDLVALAAQIKACQISPVEIVEAALLSIEQRNHDLKIYITVLAEESMAAARKAEQAIARGAYRGPLHGIPLSVKDLYWTEGIRTTAGSRVLSDYVPTQNAAVVDRLRNGGAILIGKANMKEFACAPAHPDYGGTANPWNRQRTASGSSGGSAAAVAMGTDYGSMGTDTGGSIRVPASFCGVVGFKPSFGLIPRFGMEFVSPALDHAGTLTRSVRDAAVLLDATAGFDARDAAANMQPQTSYLTNLDAQAERGGKGLTVGIVSNLIDGVEDAVRDAVEVATNVLAETGARVTDVVIPELTGDLLAAHRTIVSAEASSVHRHRFAERSEQYSPTLRWRLEEGGQVKAVDYLVAMETRDRLKRTMEQIGQSFDLLVLPTVPCPATPFEPASLSTPSEADVSSVMIRTAPFNLTGQPALTLSCGFTSDGLPIGLEIVGRHGYDHDVLQLGHAYQELTDWHRRRPF